MRAPTRTLARIGLGLAVAGAFVACADLFHDTDSPNLCDLDASAPGCGDAGTEICAADHATAEKRALHACAWLAACENPVGKNATGECVAEALQAYDCVANPNRRPKLAAKTFWIALATVKTCTDVDMAVLPKGVGNCGGAGYIGCSLAGGNETSRLQCAADGQRYFGENCILQGKTCDSLPKAADGGGNNAALCLGDMRRACTLSGCNGAHLAACDDAGLDRGLDCSQFGVGSCVPNGAQPACKPEGDLACAATADIKCTSGGVAESCASGYKESVDCTYISGPAPDNCVPIPNPPLGTPAAAACRRSAGCSVDTCSAGKLVACVAGRGVTIDCSADGLKPCNDALSTLEGTRAACTKP